MLFVLGENSVIGETICTMRASDGSPMVEQRIIIEARREHNEGDDSVSVSSESSREMATGEVDGSDGSDDDDDDDEDEEDEMSNEEANSAGEEVVESDEEAIQETPQASTGDGDALMITFSGLDGVQEGNAPAIGIFMSNFFRGSIRVFYRNLFLCFTLIKVDERDSISFSLHRSYLSEGCDMHRFLVLFVVPGSRLYRPFGHLFVFYSFFCFFLGFIHSFIHSSIILIFNIIMPVFFFY